jgi:hypothetical protein
VRAVAEQFRGIEPLVHLYANPQAFHAISSLGRIKILLASPFLLEKESSCGKKTTFGA